MATVDLHTKITLIITTYNNVSVLELVLKSVSLQSIMPCEVIIADDGSKEDTRKLVESFSSNISVPLIHCWQEDEGFRLAKIRNKAIAMSSGEYIIMVDGDMILHRHFVRDHRNNARKGYFIQGSRVLITEQKAQEILKTKSISLHFFSKGIINKLNTISCTFLSNIVSPFYGKKDYQNVRGCNMAYWKSDLYTINGFDEEFVGWGREDSEFAVRMLNNSIARKNIKFAAVAYHFWHKENIQSPEALAINQSMLDIAIKNKKMTCEKGLNEYTK